MSVDVSVETLQREISKRVRRRKRKDDILADAFKDNPLGELVKRESDAFREDLNKDFNRVNNQKGARKSYDRIKKNMTKNMTPEQKNNLKKAMAKQRAKSYSENWRRHNPKGRY